ncbi:MAG: hypothetical protein ACK5LP_05540 [Campylobacteraceae bacterium]
MKIISALMLLLLSNFVYCVEIDKNILTKNSWECKTPFEDTNSGMKISSISTETLHVNGKATSSGFVKIKFLNLQDEVIYKENTNYTWELSGKKIILKLQNLDLVNLSHPFLDEIINLKSLYQSGYATSLDFIEFSKDKITLEDKINKIRIFCNAK